MIGCLPSLLNVGRPATGIQVQGRFQQFAVRPSHCQTTRGDLYEKWQQHDMADVVDTKDVAAAGMC